MTDPPVTVDIRMNDWCAKPPFRWRLWVVLFHVKIKKECPFLVWPLRWLVHFVSQRLSGMASYEHPLLSLRSSKNQCLILRHKHHTADLDLQVYFSSSPSFQYKPYNKCLREEPTSESKRAGRKFEFARGVEISPGPRSCWPLDWANDDRLTNPSPKFGCCLRSGKSSRVTTVGVCEGSASI